jgi:6-phosphogluconolactonase/glucosamine-6-phosphate isomerase/deaminase
MLPSDVPEPTTPTPRAPALPGDVVVRPSLEELLDEVAEDVFTQANNCVRAFGDFHLALTGTRAAQRLAMRLMTDPQFRALPWTRTHVWVASERAVGVMDDRSTIGAVRGLIGDHSGIPPRQVHALAVDDPDGAERYERELKETLGWREKGHDRLDCVVLGIDERGGLEGANEAVSGAFLGEVPGVPGPTMIAMTADLVRASRLICVLGAGEHGSRAHSVVGTEAAEAVRPVGGVLRWYLDHAACGVHENGGT